VNLDYRNLIFGIACKTSTRTTPNPPADIEYAASAGNTPKAPRRGIFGRVYYHRIAICDAAP